MIDERKSRIPCWLIWSTSAAGTVTLEAISLTAYRAQTYRKILLSSSRNYVAINIEKSEVNHLFGPDLDETWWKYYGDAARERIENERVKQFKSASDTIRAALLQLWSACAKLMPNVSRTSEGFELVRIAMSETHHLIENHQVDEE